MKDAIDQRSLPLNFHLPLAQLFAPAHIVGRIFGLQFGELLAPSTSLSLVTLVIHIILSIAWKYGTMEGV